ncbi:MAG TPA: SDR family oxidoreductase, partial [Nannocystaceae bacterium]|nr:SDR family oxidoreductase [Nannocystaceae bacterium]
GHRLVATDRDLPALQDHAANARWPETQVLVRKLDVVDPIEWDAVTAIATRHFGGIDVLVNVAGYLMPGWVHEVEDDAVNLHFDVNVKGVVHGMRAVLPGMIERRRGHVINVASLAALAPIAGIGLYSASKYAVRAYSLAAAQELRTRGVKVTVVCPDAVRTPMLELQRDYEEAAMTFSGPRVLEPEDVVKAILDDALVRAPLEVWLPSHRGVLARLADLMPRAAQAIEPLLRKRGRSRQRDL